jgi:serine phosphatase RsbU (regulator of sigma subunit)
VGIFSERDLLLRAAQAPAGWQQRPVAEWMTRNPRTIQAGDSLEQAMAMMEQLRIRHLPVMADDRVVGLLTARDLMHRRTEYLNRVVEERTRELRQANERLQERDAELRLHMVVAGRLQERLLPAQLPSLPAIECHAHYEPLDPLGGDHYDFARPDPQHLGLWIADASGHSIPAAMVAIMACTAFAQAAHHDLDPAAVLARMNRHLHGLTGEHFVTGFYGVFDCTTRRLTYANAGHPFPYRYSVRSGTCQPLTAHGLMLGVLADVTYEVAQVQLESGDRLLFYTDGVIEGFGQDGQPFGAERLQAFLQDNGSQSARSLTERLADHLAAFRGSRPANDDLTIVAAEIR